MAKRSKTLVGIDIDSTGIAAASVTVNGRVRVERAAFTPLEPGIIRDGEVADVDGLADALRTLYRENKGLDKRVRVGLANQKIVVRVVDLPYLEDPKELDAAVRFHAQDQLPMPIEHAVIDHLALDTITDETGRRQRVLLVAARREMVERILSALRAAGIKPVGVDLSAFAMVRALYRPGPEDEHALYLAIGGLTNLAVARGRACTFARASGSGVEALAVELAERSQLTREHAHEWLVHTGVETPSELIEGDAEIVANARQILLDGVRRIAADVRSSLDFHRMQDDAASVSRAVMTGPATAIPGFADALASELGMPVEAGSVGRRSRGNGPRPRDGRRRPGTHGGAGMKAVNLIPADERRGGGSATGSGFASYVVLGVLALIVAVSAAYTLANRTIADQRRRARRRAGACGDLGEPGELRSRATRPSPACARSAARRSVAWPRAASTGAHALHEVARTIPSDAWLTSMRGSVLAELDRSTAAATTRCARRCRARRSSSSAARPARTRWLPSSRAFAASTASSG